MGAVSPAVRGNLQDDPREDPADGVGQHHAPDGLPPGGPHVPTGLPEGPGHGLKGFPGGHDDHRKGHDGQGQGGGQDARPEPEEEDEGADTEEGVNDGGNPGQVDDGQVDDPGEPVVRGVLAQVDGRSHTQGNRRHQGHRHQPDRPHQGREDPAGGHAVGGHGGEELPGDGPVALHHQDGEDQ